ncbi:hypothetical protein [Runella sp.]|uniref:hypothetical protein n=1 Tax=Runella sp. TaxID=1960881 RepID=UPI003D0E1EB6
MKLKTLCLLLLSSMALGQKQYLPAYYITLEGDTIRGMAEYKSMEKPFESVDFRRNNEGATETVAAENAKKIFLSSLKEEYESLKLPVRDISPNATYATSPLSVNPVYKQLFIQKKVGGAKASLYAGEDNYGITRYYVMSNSEVTELINYTYFVSDANRNNYKLTKADYKSQLKALTSDAVNFSQPTPLYRESSLRDYFIKYNSEFDPNVISYQSAAKKLLLNLAPVVGYNFNNQSPIYGGKLRVNIPGKNYNRFIRASYLWIPNTPINSKKQTVKSFTFGLGSYMGSGNIRPFFAFDFESAKSINEANAALTFSVGISYKRRIDLEIGRIPLVKTGYSEIKIISSQLSLSLYFGKTTGK